MKLLPEEVYNSNFRIYDTTTIETDTEYLADRLIAIKNGDIFTVNVYIGKQYGTYASIDNKKYSLTDKYLWYGRMSIGGYEVLDFKDVRLSTLINNEETKLKQYKNSVKRTEKRLEGLKNLKENYPELQI